MLSKARILITGATGFIGGRLLERLAVLNSDIRVVTSNFSNCARVSRYDVEIVKADLLDQKAMANVAKGCDVIFHCAYRFGGSSKEKHEANVGGTSALASGALKNGVRCFVHFSSVAAYGSWSDGAITEDREPCRIEDTYSEVKLSIEQMLLEVNRKHGLPVVILQPSIVYGPFGKTWTVDILRQLRSQLVVLPREGSGICNAVYVDDVVNAAIKSVDCADAIGERFLLSGAESTTWKNFYNAYEQMLGGYAPKPPDDADLKKIKHLGTFPHISDGRERFIPDETTLALYSSNAAVRIDKARRYLGFEPAFDLIRGMALTRAWASWANLLN